ncbi:hypothetical protein OUZ56_005643 [Daphnia magna]|uniref:Uncharacterized protein n=1 Tax=Daphnia magna TaxID=35525 RepID=A0ABQ9YTD3_9CRUS|nr:hypothetical protein OUZ56_005643 [Daphnia magna]
MAAPLNRPIQSKTNLYKKGTDLAYRRGLERKWIATGYPRPQDGLTYGAPSAEFVLSGAAFSLTVSSVVMFNSD